jgi:hypothetical protein
MNIRTMQEFLIDELQDLWILRALLKLAKAATGPSAIGDRLFCL